MVGVYMYIDW